MRTFIDSNVFIYSFLNQGVEMLGDRPRRHVGN